MAVQETVNDVYQLVRTAGAKLADHWPTLVALVLAGFTAKLAVLKLSLLAGKAGWVFGVFVFAFTAAGLAAAIVQMFRSIFPGHPWPRFTVALAPFLLIYLASNHFDGYLVDPAIERPVKMDVAAASVLLFVVAVRWVMPLWPPINDKPWAKWVRLGLDVCWISLAAFTITTHPLWQWLAGLSAPVSWVFGTVFSVLIVPLAWLALCGLVLGFGQVEAIRFFQRAGLPLILVTGLAIVLISKLPLLLWQIERLIVGAQDPQAVWLPISGLLGAANSAIGVFLTVAVVAALFAYSGRDEAGVTGQGLPAHDAHSDWFGVGRRDEENRDLVGI